MLASREEVATGGHMLRVVSSVALALSLLGCSSAGSSAPPVESVGSSAAPSAPPGESVPLLTGDLGCYAGGEGGSTAPLLAEPQYGTSFFGKPVMWPTGYTARRAGSEVEVLDTQGNVKATTGRTYHISRAYAPSLQREDDGSYSGPGTPPPTNAVAAAAECTYHHDFIDCTANPTDLWCKPVEPHGPSPTPPQPPP